MTPEQYESSLRRLNLVVYMFGKRIDNVVDNEIIGPLSMPLPKPMRWPIVRNLKIL